MKKCFLKIVALALAALTVISLVSCNSLFSIIRSKYKYKRGTIEGTQYRSEFAEITFTKPGNWVFYTDEQLITLLGAVKDMLNSEEFNTAADAETIDFCAALPDGSNSVTMSVSKGSVYTDFDKSIEKTMEELTKQFEELGWKVRRTKSDDVVVAGQEFRRITLTISTDAGNITEYIYARFSKNHFVSFAAASKNNKSAAYFEEMFSPYTEDHKAFKRSTREDARSCVSTISNLKITVPSDWSFRSDEGICSFYNLPKDSLNEELFEKNKNGFTVDFQAFSPQGNSFVTMFVYKGDEYSNAEDFIEKSLEDGVKKYSFLSTAKITTSDSITVKKLGNEDYKFGGFHVHKSGFDYSQFIFAKRVDNYLIVYTFETNQSELRREEFEAMFSSIKSDQAK